MAIDPKSLARAAWTFARSEAAFVAALAVIAAGLLAFAGIADEMSEGGAHAFDFAILQALHPDAANPSDPVGPRWLDLAAADLTALGSVSVLAALSLAAAGFFALYRKWIEAGLVVLAFGGGLALTQTLKGVFARERPPEIYRAAEILNASFPSGHALLSAVVFLSLGAMLAQSAKGRAGRIYVMGVAILLTLLVGSTRIYLGVHWTTDVLAGWAAGGTWATACWLAERRLKAWLSRP